MTNILEKLSEAVDKKKWLNVDQGKLLGSLVIIIKCPCVPTVSTRRSWRKGKGRKKVNLFFS